MAKQKSELSLMEIAKNIIEEEGPTPVLELINKTLKKKGCDNSVDKKAQLFQDIMISGIFTTKVENGSQIVDLKSRRTVDEIDKEPVFVDLHADEVKDHELGMEDLSVEGEEALGQMNQDETEEDSKTETDDIEESLGLVDADHMGEEEMFIDADEEEEEEEEGESLEDITGEIKTYNGDK